VRAFPIIRANAATASETGRQPAQELVIEDLTEVLRRGGWWRLNHRVTHPITEFDHADGRDGERMSRRR
jgi:hypothetical protein